VADRGSADEDRRRRSRHANGLDEAARRQHAAVVDPALARLGPATAGDRLAGEVDHGAGTVDLRGPRGGGAVGRPGDEALGARRRRAAAARQDDQGVAVEGEGGGERAAEEAGGAGDDNFHGLIYSY